MALGRRTGPANRCQPAQQQLQLGRLDLIEPDAIVAEQRAVEPAQSMHLGRCRHGYREDGHAGEYAEACFSVMEVAAGVFDEVTRQRPVARHGQHHVKYERPPLEPNAIHTPPVSTGPNPAQTGDLSI